MKLKKQITNNDYHGIVFNISQKDKSIFKNLNIIGKKKVFLGLITIYKISVNPKNINAVIKKIQKNMNAEILFKKQEFYSHFYRNKELIIVFKKKIFNVTTNKSTWKKVINYGKLLKIKEEQLDFKPCTIKDETF